MALKKSVKKFPGVYFTESKAKKFRGKSDRIYWIHFRETKTKKPKWVRCGRASEGWTPEAAQRKRFEILDQDLQGKYKPDSSRQTNRMTFSQFMKNPYLEWAKTNKRSSRDARSMYKTWLKERFGKKPLSAITPLDLENLKEEMQRAGRAPATIKHALGLVRHAFNKAIAWELYEGENPVSKVTMPKLNNSRERFLTKDEAGRLIKALREKSPDVANMALMSLYGGMRLGEIFELKWGSVNWDTDYILISDSKNSEVRHIYITEPIREVLESLTPGQPETNIFPTKHGNQKAWLSKSFRKVVEELGFNEGKNDRRQRVTFHTLRHTYASWAVMAGVPLFTVGKALGHKTASMTQRYAHLAPESQKAAFTAVANYSAE